jgi:hypothetical protein
MILLLSVTEADCLDHQHRRITGATKRHQRSRSVYRASGLVHRPEAALQNTENAKHHLCPTLPGFAGYIYLYKCQALTRNWLI